MANGEFTEVTTQSWGSRLGDSFKGILLGIVVLGVGFYVLASNEGRAVNRARALDEGGGIVVSVGSDAVDPANEGRLVHLSGTAWPDGKLEDEVFGVAVEAIHLERQVEMFQWRENQTSTTKEKLGGGTETTTTYSYSKGWSSSAIDSSRFKQPEGHTNPGRMPYQTRRITAEAVSIGPFSLSSGLISAMTDSKALPVESLDGLSDDLRQRAVLDGGGLFVGENPGAPAVGDLRVSFTVVRPDTVSIVARQAGDRLQPYETKHGSVQLLSYGTVDAATMFESAESANRTLTWILRLVGFLLIGIGIRTVLKPLSILFAVIPFLGRMVGAVSSFASFLLAAVLSLITIAVAWLYYRPALAIVLLLVAGGGMVLAAIAIAKSRKKGAAAEPA